MGSLHPNYPITELLFGRITPVSFRVSKGINMQKCTIFMADKTVSAQFTAAGSLILENGQITLEVTPYGPTTGKSRKKKIR